MENFEKILELLQKKSLTEAESQILKKLAESDSEINSFINIYNKLNSNLASADHIHSDLISAYILDEWGDKSDKIIPLVRNKIKAHIQECSICREEYEFLTDEYQNAKEHVGNHFKREKEQGKLEQQANNFLPRFISQSYFNYAFVTLTILFLGYVVLFTISSSVTPYYEKNIFAQGEDEFFTTRGRTSVLFQQGLNSIENHDYDKAIEFLSEDILVNKSDKSIFYSYYIMGITYLRAAESDFIGLFKSFDRQGVELAISNLRESIDRNSSGDYENLKLDSYYYIARAYLIIEDYDSARSSLQKVINGKGKFSIDSKELIEQMEKN